MKRLLSVMLVGLSFMCIASLAAPPYVGPNPGMSCSSTFPGPYVNGSTTDPSTVSFCGCYAGDAQAICKSTVDSECSEPSSVLASMTCQQVAGNETNFCQHEYSLYGPTINVANCIADLNFICGKSAVGTGLCNACWANGTCYSYP